MSTLSSTRMTQNKIDTARMQQMSEQEMAHVVGGGPGTTATTTVTSPTIVLQAPQICCSGGATVSLSPGTTGYVPTTSGSVSTPR